MQTLCYTTRINDFPEKIDDGIQVSEIKSRCELVDKTLRQPQILTEVIGGWGNINPRPRLS